MIQFRDSMKLQEKYFVFYFFHLQVKQDQNHDMFGKNLPFNIIISASNQKPPYFFNNATLMASA